MDAVIYHCLTAALRAARRVARWTATLWVVRLVARVAGGPWQRTVSWVCRRPPEEALLWQDSDE